MARGLIALVALTAACSHTPVPLAETSASAREHAARVLRAFAAGDRGALHRLALSEAEFRDHVWPSLPAARPERGLPFAYVWGELAQKSDASLDAALASTRGQRLELVDVRLGRATRYGAATVHRDAVFVIRAPGGAAEDRRLCGSMVERDGRWKVFSYVVD